MLVQASWSTLTNPNDSSECKFVLRSTTTTANSSSDADDASYVSNSSEYSALRFSRGSPISNSTR